MPFLIALLFSCFASASDCGDWNSSFATSWLDFSDSHIDGENQWPMTDVELHELVNYQTSYVESDESSSQNIVGQDSLSDKYLPSGENQWPMTDVELHELVNYQASYVESDESSSQNIVGQDSLSDKYLPFIQDLEALLRVEENNYISKNKSIPIRYNSSLSPLEKFNNNINNNVKKVPSSKSPILDAFLFILLTEKSYGRIICDTIFIDDFRGLVDKAYESTSKRSKTTKYEARLATLKRIFNSIPGAKTSVNQVTLTVKSEAINVYKDSLRRALAMIPQK